MNPQEQRFVHTAVSLRFLSNEQAQHVILQKRQTPDMPLRHILEQYMSPAQLRAIEQKIVQRREVTASTIDLEEHFKAMEPTAKRLSASQSFGKYELLRELGKGSMGRVFLAHDPNRGRVALKAIIAGEIADESREERFLREIGAMQRLDHPNIIKIHDVGKENGLLYFTMDYIEGQNLLEIMAAKKISSRRCAEIIAQVARAIHHAHTNNVLHRDIKPENIMIVGSKVPIITDFGLARPIRQSGKLTKTGIIVGTPSYMSPEQARGIASAIDQRSDVYALGATLYHLLTGQVPFIGSDPLAILSKVVQIPPKPLREINPLIPQDLENICLKALQKEKQNRFASAIAMAEDLERFVEGIAVEAAPPRASLQSIKGWIKDHGKVIAIVSLVLITVAIGSLILSQKQARQSTPTTQPVSQEIAFTGEVKLQTGQKTTLPFNMGKLQLSGTITDKDSILHVLCNKSEADWNAATGQFHSEQLLGYGLNEIEMIVLHQDQRWFRQNWDIERVKPTDIRGFSRGNRQRTGVYQSKRVSLRRLRWRYATPREVQRDIIASNGMVYFIDEAKILYAVDVQTGQLQWQVGNVEYSPCLYNGFVYFTNTERRLYIADMYNGQLQQFINTPICSPPTIVQGIAYFVGMDKNFYALDVHSKKILWQTEIDLSFASPTIGDEMTYVIGDNGYCYAIDRKTSKKAWQKKVGSFSHSPVLSKGIVYAFSRRKLLWALDAKDGKELWEYRAKTEIRSDIAVANSIVYIQDGEKYHELNAKTGKPLWHRTARQGVQAAPIISDGIAYIGTTAIHSPSGNNFAQFDLETRHIFSAAISDGVLFLGTEQGVYAIE